MRPILRTVRVTACALAVVTICCLSLTSSPVSVPPIMPQQNDIRPVVSCSPSMPGANLGIATSAHIYNYSSSDLAVTASELRDLGTKWIRLSIDWAWIEQTKGSYDWETYDRVVNAASAAGVTVLGVIQTTPAWARIPGAQNNLHSLPADPNAFVAFAAAAAEHYRTQISTWEIWNEPNLAEFAAPTPSITRYGAMIQLASTMIKQVQPGTSVIMGGLSPASDDGTDISPLTFLRSLYAADISWSWDAVSMHPYTYPALPSAPNTYSWNPFQRMQGLYQVMSQYGDSSKQIWMTEFGAPTSLSSVGVSADVQSQSIAEAIVAQRTYAFLGPLFVYTDRDAGTNLYDTEENFGLLRYDYTRKPAFDVVSELAHSC